MANLPSSSNKIKIFISYSHEDEELRKGLEKQLSVLKREGSVLIWNYRDISAGDEWKRQIDEHLNSSQLILLLISSDFLYSEYCYEREMKRAMELHESGQVRVVPIILRPSDWKKAPFGKLQALPANAEPVVSRKWGCVDEAFLDIAMGIRKIIEKMQLTT